MASLKMKIQNNLVTPREMEFGKMYLLVENTSSDEGDFLGEVFMRVYHGLELKFFLLKNPQKTWSVYAPFKFQELTTGTQVVLTQE